MQWSQHSVTTMVQQIINMQWWSHSAAVMTTLRVYCNKIPACKFHNSLLL